MVSKSKASAPPRVSLDQVKETLASSGKRGDALRADGLAGLALVKRAKLAQTQRERARLALRHGEKSKRVARLDRQMALEHRALVNSRAEADRLQTPVPTRDVNSWQVHGYLRSRDGLACAGYQVGVYADPDGRTAPIAGAYSDNRGYYVLTPAKQAEGQAQAKRQAGVKSQTREQSKASSAREAAAAAKEQAQEETKEEAKLDASLDRLRLMAQALKTPVYLGTTVPGQSGVAIDPRPLHLEAGSIVYRDVTVADPKDDVKRSAK